jgi:hypothetical protein
MAIHRRLRGGGALCVVVFLLSAAATAGQPNNRSAVTAACQKANDLYWQDMEANRQAFSVLNVALTKSAERSLEIMRGKELDLAALRSADEDEQKLVSAYHAAGQAFDELVGLRFAQLKAVCSGPAKSR